MRSGSLHNTRDGTHFDPKSTRKDWTKVEIYTWSLPVIEATFFIGKEQADEDLLCSD
jgi:hypothetical protein